MAKKNKTSKSSQREIFILALCKSRDREKSNRGCLQCTRTSPESETDTDLEAGGYGQQDESHMNHELAKLGYASHLAAIFDALLVNSVIVQYKGQGGKEQQRHLKY